MKLGFVAGVIGIAAMWAAHSTPVAAQWQGTSAAQWAGTGKIPPPTPELVAKGDVKSVVFKWTWYMGMLRGWQELENATMFDLRQAQGTVRVGGQACRTSDYRAAINYQVSGMRVSYTCTLPNGQSHKAIEVVSGQTRGVPVESYVSPASWPGGMFIGKPEAILSWDEDVVGAGLTPDHPGRVTPKPDTRTERLIRLWASPWGAPKAVLADPNAKVAMEGGKPTVTYAIPFVTGAIAKATLNPDNQAERIEVRQGNTITEFIYEKYGDYNPEDDKIDGFTPGHIVEKRDGVTILDLNVALTHVGNLYAVMPIPEAVQKAAAR